MVRHSTEAKWGRVGRVDKNTRRIPTRRRKWKKCYYKQPNMNKEWWKLNTSVMTLKELVQCQCYWLILRMCPVWILIVTPDIQTGFFLWFSLVSPSKCHASFQILSSFFLNLSFYHTVLYISADYVIVKKSNDSWCVSDILTTAEWNSLPFIKINRLTCWMPMTSFTQSRLEMMFNRTSGHSSFSCERKSGSRCSMVLCLPSIGLRPIMTEASADLTCWLGSPTSSFTNGRIFVMMIDSCW